MTIKAGDLAAELGKGLVAGAVGTAAMTLSSTIEMKRRGREASTTPADAASKVLDVEPTGEREKEKFSNLVHFGYGTSWGSVRALLEAFGLRGPTAAGIHFAAVWGAGLVMLPSLKVAPPVSEWGPPKRWPSTASTILSMPHQPVSLMACSTAGPPSEEARRTLPAPTSPYPQSWWHGRSGSPRF